LEEEGKVIDYTIRRVSWRSRNEAVGKLLVIDCTIKRFFMEDPESDEDFLKKTA